MADEDLSDQIREAASAPKQVTVDGQTVVGQDVAALIAADQYLASKVAASTEPLGLRFRSTTPPGAV